MKEELIIKKCVKEQIVSVNTFDLSDYIITLHKNTNTKLSLCKLQVIIFFYQIASKTTHVIPYVDDDFFLKNNFIYLKDIEHKYRKEKREDIALLNKPCKPATFASFGSACKLLKAFTEYFKNYSNRQLKGLVRKTPSYLKYKKNNNIFIKMEKKDFSKYYPLKRWEDAYNMILSLDDKIPLFRL